MRKPTLIVLAGITLAICRPGYSAAAAETSVLRAESEVANLHRDPHLARTLVVLTPVVLFGTALVTQRAEIAYMVPFSFGAGHFYAGDPIRGTFFSLGAPLAIAGGAAAGFALGGGFAPNPTNDPPSYLAMVMAMLGAGYAAAGWGGWAGLDAYETTIRLNEERRRGKANPTATHETN